MKIHVLSLGCARALVDSEGLAGLLEASGHKITDRLPEAECVVINTCSFIQAAEEESVSTILDAAKLKRIGKLKRLYVTGCLPQKRKNEKEDLLKLLPEVDGFLGTGDLARLPELIELPVHPEQAVHPSTKLRVNSASKDGSRFFVASPVPTLLFGAKTPRRRLSPAHSAYLKISEGCDHACTFCSIPQFRGPHRSRTIEDIAEEAERLAGQGVVELNLIGQDSSYYGMDQYGTLKLPDLLERLNRIEKVRWIRILYAHPAHVTPGLIGAIRDLPKVAKYLDIPLQHISSRLLASMRRETDGAWIRRLVEALRREIPEIAIRTTFIVGFPGEMEEEVDQLAQFMQAARFDRVGIFPYSTEPKTPAERMQDQIPEPVKQKRLDRLMRLQQGISQELTQRWLGKSVEVLVEECVGENSAVRPESVEGQTVYLGRTYADAPEVDGQVFLHAKGLLQPGQFVTARVTDTYEYDLAAEAI